MRGEILEKLYDQQGGEEAVFAVLALVLTESRAALELCQSTYSGEEYAFLFRRFYVDDKPRYRVYFAIAALCALLRDDLSELSMEPADELARMTRFHPGRKVRRRDYAEHVHPDQHDGFFVPLPESADAYGL